MTQKQRRFCEEYCIDFNAAAAARRAGYSAKTARFIGAENLTKPNIQEAIATQLRAISKACMLDATWIRSKLKENVERAMQATRPVDKDGCPCGDWQYQGTVANKALELLGKDATIGMFAGKRDVASKSDRVSIVEVVLSE